MYFTLQLYQLPRWFSCRLASSHLRTSRVTWNQRRWKELC